MVLSNYKDGSSNSRNLERKSLRQRGIAKFNAKLSIKIVFILVGNLDTDDSNGKECLGNITRMPLVLSWTLAVSLHMYHPMFILHYNVSYLDRYKCRPQLTL